MAKKLNIRLNRLQKEFKQDNIYLVKAINKIENFGTRYNLITSDSIQDYMNGKRNTNKIIIVTLMRIAMALCIIKYLLSFFTKNRMIMALINDETHLVGNPRLVSLMLSMLIGCIQLVGLCLQHMIITNSFYALDFMQMLKVFSRSNRFYMRNHRKFGRRINLVVSVLIDGYYVLVIGSSLTFILALCLSYNESNGEYYLPCLFFWCFVTVLAHVYFQSQTVFLIVISILVVLYLIYKFKDLDKSIAYFAKLRDVNSMIRVIIEHDAVAVLTHKLNKVARFDILVLLYFGAPALQLLSYMTHQEKTLLNARLTSWSFLISYSLLFLPMCMMVTKFNQWAHRPINRIYFFLAKSKVDLR